MKKVELLAPAGNFECLKAAINNGANAVYLGGKNFSARAFANNFDKDELIKAVEYAHLRDVKVYVTLNTILNEDEISNAIKMAEFYYQNNVDALLVQDLGLFYYIKTNFPDFELHCSTQMHVHNIQGILNAKKLGFKRVVIARESSLDFIKEATKQGIEIETFVHGAICVSYSGQCLMSSVTKNRSANKGMCAQCCRLKYELFDEQDNKIKTDTDYLLSPKDMCLINDIPKLIEAGVSSFKIEGRLKSSAYVGYVTSMYRKAIDAYYNNEKFVLTNEETDNLKVLFNRNFTNDYLFNRNDLFGQVTPNHLGIEIGEVISNKNNHTYIKLSSTLNQFDGIRISNYGCICNMIYKDNLLVNQGLVGDIISIKTDSVLNGKVYKTLDHQLEQKINNYNDLKLPIKVKISILANKNVEVLINNYQYISNIVAQEALKSPITKENIFNQFSKLNETCFYINEIEIETDNAFLPIKQLNEIRRDSIKAYETFKLNSFKRVEISNSVNYVEPKYDEIGDLSIDNTTGVNYVINPDSEYSNYDIPLICEFGGILDKNNNKIAYYTLNCCNSYTYEFLKKIGFANIILSTEINDIDIQNIKKAYLQRNSVNIKPYVLQDGNRVLMYLKANPFDKYIDNSKKYYIKDFNNKYLIRHNHSITELVEVNDNQNITNIDFNQKFIIV